MPLMLIKKSFDTVCHEHLEYYSLSVLQTIMARAGLRIFKIEFKRRQRRQHPLLVAARPPASPTTARRRATSSAACRSANSRWSSTPIRPTASSGAARPVAGRDDGLVGRIRAEGKDHPRLRRLHQGQCPSAMVRARPSQIPYAADRNEDKVGAMTLGTDIRDPQRGESRAMRPITTWSCPGISGRSSWSGSARPSCQAPR